MLTNKFKSGSVTVITTCCNDKEKVTKFVDHYLKLGVDSIVLILDNLSNDGTRELYAHNPRIDIRDVGYPNGPDKTLEKTYINNVVKQYFQCWILIADIEERLKINFDKKNLTQTDTLFKLS